MSPPPKRKPPGSPKPLVYCRIGCGRFNLNEYSTNARRQSSRPSEEMNHIHKLLRLNCPRGQMLCVKGEIRDRCLRKDMVYLKAGGKCFLDLMISSKPNRFTLPHQCSSPSPSHGRVASTVRRVAAFGGLNTVAEKYTTHAAATAARKFNYSPQWLQRELLISYFPRCSSCSASY